MSNYKQFFSQFKRKQPESTSSVSDADSPEAQQVKKKLNLESDPEDMETQMSVLMTEIDRRLDTLKDTLASKQDISSMKKEMKTEMDNLSATFINKIGALEEKILNLESEKMKLQEEVSVLRRTNGDLFKQMNNHSKQMASMSRAQNDIEQQGRKWNLRVFNVAEADSDQTESASDCTKKVCKVFSTMVGVPVTEDDIEVAHRTGKRLPERQGQTRKCRPVIVRFLSRKKKDEVLAHRRRLKGNRQKISISEDLTYLNYKLLTEAKNHSATLDAWSTNGKIIAKLKNGKTIRLEITDDVDGRLRNEM